MVVANVKYKKPTFEDSKRQKGLLRYLTYRDGRDGHIRQAGGVERWHDLGLGRALQEVAQRCEAYKGEHVLAWTLVFNPNPELMHLVAPEQREQFVCELTERALAEFFEERGIEGGVEASYVLHHRNSENPEAPGLHDPHAHLILPGTYFDEATGQRENLFFSRRQQENHIELLHQVTEDTMVDLMDRYVGLEWGRRFDALEAVRAQERSITENEPPHGVSLGEEGREYSVWAGVRRADDSHSAVGYYTLYEPDERQIEDDADPRKPRVEFRPLIADLSHAEAQALADFFKDYLSQGHTLQALMTSVEDWLNRRERVDPLPEPEIGQPEDDYPLVPDLSLDLSL
jgi:hypothetical protein